MIRFVISTFTPLFFIEMSFVYPPPPREAKNLGTFTEQPHPVRSQRRTPPMPGPRESCIPPLLLKLRRLLGGGGLFIIVIILTITIITVSITKNTKTSLTTLPSSSLSSPSGAGPISIPRSLFAPRRRTRRTRSRRGRRRIPVLSPRNQPG